MNAAVAGISLTCVSIAATPVSARPAGGSSEYALVILKFLENSDQCPLPFQFLEGILSTWNPLGFLVPPPYCFPHRQDLFYLFYPSHW